MKTSHTTSSSGVFISLPWILALTDSSCAKSHPSFSTQNVGLWAKTFDVSKSFHTQAMLKLATSPLRLPSPCWDFCFPSKWSLLVSPEVITTQLATRQFSELSTFGSPRCTWRTSPRPTATQPNWPGSGRTSELKFASTKSLLWEMTHRNRWCTYIYKMVDLSMANC